MSEVRLGVWAMLGEPRTAAELERSGLDWVVLDAQHGHFDDRAVRETLSLRRERLVPVLVRVRANDAALIGRALDAGADGVIVPLVETAAEAEAVVAAASYPPRGSRSWGPLRGLERTDGADGGPPKPLIVVMVETAGGLAAVSAIAATPGLGMVLVGPNDLALSLGITVDALLADDRPDAPLPTVVRACRDAGVLPGAFGATVERAAVMARLGFEWVVAGLDTDLLASGGALARRVRERLG
ncbi:MAG: 4-hydroxy-2-oxoheptanedioate aldolase [Microbacteriaceae bacterium]|jgi:4-hydroxy-2-oxoheptanedioate aldolase|nr:4-hydroxy-2-oxoheptanedioate aldolase [Microbacteriaceae bacterium]